MANNFKNGLDRQEWIYVQSSPNAHAAGGSLCCDLRNDISRHPFIFQLVSATVLNRFNFLTKAWGFVVSPALAGTFGAGAGCVFAPSFALVGNIGAGSSTTRIVTSTTITSVGANMLANRGGGTYGFKIRIIGSSAGGSGKVEERFIIGNSSGTTPTILLDSALSFTPASGDKYEIISGKVFMLSAGTLASGVWKSFEVAQNLLTTCGYTNLPATIATDTDIVALDEQYVPSVRKPGEGFLVGAGTYDTVSTDTTKNCLIATASASGTLTGQSSGGDYAVLANEYRNFQIRIVEDTAIPTAVNQRRIIASHTAGASPVYTLGSAWTVTPSSTAKYVIEYPNLIVVRTSAATTTYTYNYTNATINNGTNSIAADAWSTAYIGASANACGAGVIMLPSYGIMPDTDKNARHSYIYQFRGGGSSSLDLLDIAGGTTGAWTAAIVYDGAVTFTTGSSGKYAPHGDEGRFGFLNSYTASALNQMYRFDVKNRVLSPETPTDWVQAGTAAAGGRVASYAIIDGSDRYSCVFLLSHLAANAMELVIQI